MITRATFWWLLLAFLVRPAFGQVQNEIPDFGAGAASTVVGGQTETWTGTREIAGWVAVRGTLVLAGTLRATGVMVYPGGFLDVQSGSTLEFANTPINLSADPLQFGTGLIVLGRVRMLGVDKTPFVRTSVEPVAGATTLTLASAPSGWVVGDRIFLPDTRQTPQALTFVEFQPQHEIRIITAIAGDTLTLNMPLTFDHRGARDADGTPTVLADGTRLLPHVANLTRSIVIRSVNASGTRGHTIYTDRANVEIRNVRFEDLGRTTTERIEPGVNQIGRYPLHIHHLMGPVNPTNTGYQFTLVGNVIENSRKWAMAVHTSHFGLIEGNVIIGGPQYTGAGIAVEDGDETENLFRGNFVADIRGNQNPFSSASDDALNGTAGECYWSKSYNNRFVNNVAAGCRNHVQQIVSGVGWKYLQRAALATVYNPRFRGADHHNPAEMIAVNPQRQPILQHENNEVYGLGAAALTAWFLGSNGAEPYSGQLPSTVKGLRVWHTYQAAVYFYPTHRVTLDGLVYRPDSSQPVNQPALDHGDYLNTDLTIRNANLHANTVYAGRHALRTMWLEDNRVTSRDYAFSFNTPDTQGGGPVLQDRTGGVTYRLARNVVTAWPGQMLKTIEMNHDLSRVPNDTVNPFNVYVTDHQGVAGDSFRVCFAEQATQNLYGGLCPNATTRLDIDGILVGASSPPPPPPPAEVCGDGIDNDGDGQIDEDCAPPPSGSIVVTPSSVTWTFLQGSSPNVATLTATPPNGQMFTTMDTSPYFSAPDCYDTRTCPAGASFRLIPYPSVTGLAVGTYPSSIAVRSAGVPDVVVPVTLTVTASSPPPPPADSDGDGVTDDLDKCPGTPTGTTVDASGCAVVVPPPPTDPCVSVPLRITGIKWPAQPTGNRSGTWNSGSFVLVKVGFEWLPSLRLVAVDTRGCTTTVIR